MFQEKKVSPDENQNNINRLASDLRDLALEAVGLSPNNTDYFCLALEPNSGLRVEMSTFEVNWATETETKLSLRIETGDFEAMFSHFEGLTYISLAGRRLYPMQPHASGASNSPEIEELVGLLTCVKDRIQARD
jgi:hypothetical protein